MSRKGFFIVILNSGAKRSVIQNPLQPQPMRHTGWIFGRAMSERMRTKPVRWRETMSFPTTRIIQIRAGVSFINLQCVTPASEPESPASIEGFKIYSVLCNSSNYATLNQLCIQAHSSSLRCGGSLCKVQSDENMLVQ